jgi:hypothetical protein
MMPLWNKFALTQQHILSELFATGVLHGHDEKLRMYAPQPSIKAAWEGAWTPRDVITPRSQSYAPSVIDATLAEDIQSQDQEDDSGIQTTRHSLLRVYSFLHAMT